MSHEHTLPIKALADNIILKLEASNKLYEYIIKITSDYAACLSALLGELTAARCINAAKSLQKLTTWDSRYIKKHCNDILFHCIHVGCTKQNRRDILYNYLSVRLLEAARIDYFANKDTKTAFISATKNIVRNLVIQMNNNEPESFKTLNVAINWEDCEIDDDLEEYYYNYDLNEHDLIAQDFF